MDEQADYSTQNLRGRSFRGEHLDGVDFSDADVRATDFSHASLVGANFTDCRMGIRPVAGVVLLLGAMVVSILAGVAIGFFAELTREQIQSSDWRDVFAAVLMVFVVLAFFGVLLVWGVLRAVQTFAAAVVVIILLDFLVVFIFAGEIRFRNSIPLIVLLILVMPAVVAGILGRLVGGTFGAWAIAIVAVAGGLAAGRAQGGVSAIVVSVLLVMISKRALKGDSRDGPMRYLGHRIVTQRGTRFAHADLTRATFTGTNPVHSDMCSATTMGTIWDPEHIPYTHEHRSKKVEGSS